MAFWNKKKPAGKSLDEEAEEAASIDDDDSTDDDAAREEAAYAAAEAAAYAAAAPPSHPPCPYETFVEIQTHAMHWKNFEADLKRQYGFDTTAWIAMNAYWGVHAQDPALVPVYWAARNRVEAQYSAAATAAAASEPELVASNAPGPQGLSWARAQRPFGAADLPAGGDWQHVEHGGKLQAQSEHHRMVVVMQAQQGTDPAMRAPYLDSFVAVNVRDAPRYRSQGVTLGRVGTHPAGRVDGEFVAAIHFATRDYVVFAGGNAVMLMVRGPIELAAAVHAIADRVAASFVST